VTGTRTAIIFRLGEQRRSKGQSKNASLIQKALPGRQKGPQTITQKRKKRIAKDKPIGKTKHRRNNLLRRSTIETVGISKGERNNQLFRILGGIREKTKKHKKQPDSEGQNRGEAKRWERS